MSLGQLCEAIGVSRQSYYAHIRSGDKRELLESLIVDFVKRIRHVLDRLGCNKLWVLHLEIFPRFGFRTIGRDRFFSILRRHNLLLKRKKRGAPKTTYSRHNYAVQPNLIKDLEVTHPNQVYVSDVTYIWISNKWYYLTLITDKYSKRIVGWSLDEDHDHDAVQKAVAKTLAKNKQAKPIILHSDRGSEYCCHDLIEYLKKNNIISSMTDADHCAQNALAERMNGIIKQEFIPQDGFDDEDTARKSIAHSINLYNTVRPHRSLAMRAPDEVHNGDYDRDGRKLRKYSSTKSASEILQSLFDSHSLLGQLRGAAV